MSSSYTGGGGGEGGGMGGGKGGRGGAKKEEIKYKRKIRSLCPL